MSGVNTGVGTGKSFAHFCVRKGGGLGSRKGKNQNGKNAEKCWGGKVGRQTKWGLNQTRRLGPLGTGSRKCRGRGRGAAQKSVQPTRMPEGEAGVIQQENHGKIRTISLSIHPGDWTFNQRTWQERRKSSGGFDRFQGQKIRGGQEGFKGGNALKPRAGAEKFFNIRPAQETKLGSRKKDLAGRGSKGKDSERHFKKRAKKVVLTGRKKQIWKGRLGGD